MNIIFGDNPLENVAVRQSDMRVRETYVVENEQVQNILDEQAKKVAKDGVVLELDKIEENVSNTRQTEAEAVNKVQNSTKAQEQAKAEHLVVENEERRVAETQRVLENINI